MARGRAITLLIVVVVSCSFLLTNRFSITWTRSQHNTTLSATNSSVASVPAPPKAILVATTQAPTTQIPPSTRPVPCKSQFSENRISWKNGKIPQTTLPVHTTGDVPTSHAILVVKADSTLNGFDTGWSVFDNLYTFNGTLYIVSDEPGGFPPIREMASSGSHMGNSAEEIAAQEPSDADMQIISTAEATALFGHSISRLNGVTFWVITITLLLVFIGLWRTYSALDLHITASGDTVLPPVSRMFFPHASRAFHDPPGLNQVVLRAAFPSIAVEYIGDWHDRASTQKAIYMDRVVLTARTTSLRSKKYDPDAKMISVADNLPKSPYWWCPIRRQVLEFSGAPEEVISLNPSGKPVITYISRQGWGVAGGRKLLASAHDSLAEALKGLEASHGYEVHVVEMERLSKAEQMELAARTTIMIGVHGNGLSSLLWMKPSPSATVIEIFFPPGFETDYSVPARVLGIEHYGVWGDRYFRTESEHKPRRHQPDGFHRDQIPADGPTIAALCVERIQHSTLLSSKL
ncbi:hypothetical protein FRB97_000786 [Tulasnella sp. 331]|nr:hypothetical protein FRB97_000786 [Tulasnella sp. 331]KAG8888385.1 hypothetical protein FRB98_007780 [Tulasnella sp. 332]